MLKACEMFDGNHSSEAGAGSHGQKRTGSGSARHESYIQCRQCSERFPMRATLSCPRCGRLNDRSIVALGFKLVAFILFIATVTWTAWVTTKVDRGTKSERVKQMPQTSPDLARQPDLRF